MTPKIQLPNMYLIHSLNSFKHPHHPGLHKCDTNYVGCNLGVFHPVLAGVGIITV
jgi:hypothetical protein